MTDFAKSYEVPANIVNNVITITENSPSIADLPFEQLEMLHDTTQEFLVNADAKTELDQGCGIISVYYSFPENMPLERQIIASTAMFSLINQAFYNPAPEPNNNLPYTTFRSSTEKPEQMMEAGVKFYTPDQKLGFHNDVFFDGDKYSIPRYVSLLNLFIGYDQPGNFYYIHQRMWDEFDNLYQDGIGKTFKFRPTPVVLESHLDKGRPHTDMDKWTKIPAFWEDKSGSRYAFSNGELLDEAGTTVVSRLKETLLNNRKKMAVPQKTNQVMVFRNDVGFHSRDIFKEQKVFEGTTRLFLRAVSSDAVAIPY